MSAKTVHLNHILDEGMPSLTDFSIVESPIPELNEGEALMETHYISADPYLRGRIKASGGMKGGDVMVGFTAGKITASKHPKTQLDSGSVIKLTDIVKEEELSLGIGLLGMPGSTAYGGLIDVLKVQNGEVLFVSAASGAVGSLVGMIAKRVYNCTVIGSAGGPEKCKLIKEKFGFDFAIDYKVASDKDKLKAALKEVAPKGIDMYFENVGGYHFEAAFESLAPHGRIAVCGGISEYNNATANKVSINPMQMVYTFQRIEGFVCSPWLSGKKGNFLDDMNKWRLEGKLVAEETVFEGIESWPAAFRSLFTGEKLGKVVVKV